MAQWSTIRDRAAGKWQIPLFAVSLLLLAGSVYRIRPTSTRLPVDEAIRQLDSLVSVGQHAIAIERGEVLLLKEGLSEAEKAPVLLALARARFDRAQSEGTRTADLGRLVMEHYRTAISQGLELTGSDWERLGRASEWAGHFENAADYYEKAVLSGVDSPFDVQKHRLELLRLKLDVPAKHLDELLHEFLADLGDERLDLRLWAIERKLDVLEELGRLEEASTLLARNEEAFRASSLEPRFSYLEGWLMYKTGHHDQAEIHLRTVRNGLMPGDKGHARTGWLLGVVAMSDGGPQRPLEALSFFSDVIRYHPGSPYGVASRVGSAEALAMLGRHPEAVSDYRLVIEELEDLDDQRLVNRDVLRTSLGIVAEERGREGQLRASLDYARLAAALIDLSDIEQATVYLQRLGQGQALLAETLHAQATKEREEKPSATDSTLQEARALFEEAGETYLSLAKLNVLNELLSADASWRAAELYARAGKRDRAALLRREFVKERPLDSRVPRALLLIGRLREALGQLPEAIKAYQECYRRFPRTLDGSRSLVPLAGCYLVQGPGNEELAEKTLRVVLDDSEVFTPQAPEFADALFMLGDVLNRREEFEGAVATLEEALERYPQDSRVLRAQFWLADSYRRSGLALKRELADAKFTGETNYMRAESSTRLDRARALYREVIGEYELRDPAELTGLDRLYLRHAHLYEADCRFETQQYRGALKLYEEAAGMFKDTPSALAAFVQIINCHVFLGQPREARAALARAVILVDAIPQGAFDESVSPQSRADWRRYLGWLGSAELF